jgi:hypothetical protein
MQLPKPHHLGDFPNLLANNIAWSGGEELQDKKQTKSQAA